MCLKKLKIKKVEGRQFYIECMFCSKDLLITIKGDHNEDTLTINGECPKCKAKFDIQASKDGFVII